MRGVRRARWASLGALFGFGPRNVRRCVELGLLHVGISLILKLVHTMALTNSVCMLLFRSVAENLVP